MLISKILTIYLKLSKLIAYQITVGRKQTHQRLMTVKHFEGACILSSLLGEQYHSKGFCWDEVDRGGGRSWALG
jgi:hypothetical protein